MIKKKIVILIVMLLLTSCTISSNSSVYIDCNSIWNIKNKSDNFFISQIFGLGKISNDGTFVSNLKTGHFSEGDVHLKENNNIVIEHAAKNTDTKEPFSWFLKIYISGNSAYISLYGDLDSALSSATNNSNIDNSDAVCPLVSESEYLESVSDFEHDIKFPVFDEGFGLITYEMDTLLMSVDAPYLTLIETGKYIYEAERINELHIPIEHIYFTAKYDKYFRNFYKLEDYEEIYSGEGNKNESYFIEYNDDNSLTLYLYDEDIRMLFRLFNYVEKNDFR